uniref:Uncharacterized protein n=1 Tax=Strigamia maritima TaxID=126957 RepID=T1JKZ3_STRMM
MKTAEAISAKYKLKLQIRIRKNSGTATRNWT